MPLDILMEIVVLLHPRDLLNLARTSKEWRAFLMNRRQEPLWKAARTQQEPTLPDLPPFLSEPAYANLMFFKDCSGCLKPNANNIYWEFGMRLCKPECSGLLSLYYRTSHPDVHYTIERELGDTGYTYLACVYPPPRSRHLLRAYLPSELDDFRRRWQNLSTKEEKLHFLQECHEAVRKRTAICKQLSKWDATRKADRSDELATLKEERFSAIQRRLADEGWDKELDFMGLAGLQRLSSLKCVKKSVKLTDKMWSNMHKEVIEYMQEYRTKRLSYERRALVERRIKFLRDAYDERFTTGIQHDGIKLSPGDLAYVPAFAELLEAGNDVEVSERSFLLLMTQERWPGYVSQWKEHIKGRLERIALADLTGNGVQVDDARSVLQLAVAQFRCRARDGCKEDMRWPDILSHPCFRFRALRTRPVIDLDFNASVKFVCKGDVFLVNRESTQLHPAALEVVVACGQNPGKVTYEEMQACPMQLVCNREPWFYSRCARPQPLLDWRAAIEHRRTLHSSDPYNNRWKEAPWKVVANEPAEQPEASNVVEVVCDSKEQGEPVSSRILGV
ncbi:hypothetical protein GY45DRAFT_1324643 [Cubamyces sp. BRFM 1775]|nr:hypothetical protein GY45DRAFT_1324643 [Cubamyces sp. BRFM 1775]